MMLDGSAKSDLERTAQQWKGWSVEGVARKAVEYIEQLETQVPKWISVKERLPDAFVYVLVQMPGEAPHPTVREGFISDDGIWCAGYFKREPDEVTHWAKMPEPQKEGE